MKSIWRSSILVAGFILAWMAVVYFFALPNYILPSPARVLRVFYQQPTLLLTHTYSTLLETCLGFLLGILFGALAAIVMVAYQPLKAWGLPLLIISQAIPIFAIAPLLVIWLGYGLASKIATTVLMIFFPITSAFYDGLNRTPPGWIALAKTMQSSKWRTFCAISIPAALPALASGIRIAAVTAPVGAIIGEWVGSSSGLGYLMINANARMQIDQMFAAVLIIILMALGLYFGVEKILKKLVWWN